MKERKKKKNLFMPKNALIPTEHARILVSSIFFPGFLIILPYTKSSSMLTSAFHQC